MKKFSLKFDRKRWSTYAAAGVAASVAGANCAEADIHHTVVGSANGGNIDFNVDGYFNITGDASLNVFNFSGWAGVGIYNTANSFRGDIAGFESNGSAYAARLNAGVNISTQNFLPASTFATMAFQGGYTNSQFLNQGGFIAFRFDVGAGTQFGWARFNLRTGTPTNEYELVDFAWADFGDSIAVGQTAIPEPTALGVLALGAAGLLASRRRRQVA